MAGWYIGHHFLDRNRADASHLRITRQRSTPEYQPDLDFEDHAFEESRGMGASYGYNREEDIQDYSSAQALVLSLVDLASRGGNFLLDIGPDASRKNTAHYGRAAAANRRLAQD